MFLSQHIAVFLLWLCFAILSVHGNPWGWGPGSNSDHPAGGPAWNGGDQSTDNIIIHQKDNGGNGNWHY